MIARHRQAIELAAIFKSHRHAAFARAANDFLHPSAMPAKGNNDAVERAPSLQRFFHRVNS
jgi:hypothetical protein